MTKSYENHYSSSSSVKIVDLAQMVEHIFEEYNAIGSNPIFYKKQKSTVANEEKCLKPLW